MVNRGKAAFFIGDVFTSNRILTERHLDRVLMIGQTEYTYDISMGFRHDQSELMSIFDKTLRQIRKQSESDIEAQWIGRDMRRRVDPAVLVTFGSFVLIVLTVVSMQFLYHQRKRAVLAEHASTDVLTGLRNRGDINSLFQERKRQCIDDGKVLVFMIFDVDHFKAYNDFYGHQRGDKALIRVADFFRGVFRRSVDCTFRLGGEDLGVLTIVNKPEDGEFLAENLRRHIEASGISHSANGPLEVLTVSGGVINVRPHRDTMLKELYHRADKRLYSAKQRGRNIIVS